MLYDKNDAYLYVGEDIKFVDEHSFNRYTLYTCISGKDIDLHFDYLDDRVQNFENGANVIHFSDDVFNRLMTVRVKSEDELEYGLSDETIREVKRDYHEMTKEFSFAPSEACSKIKTLNK